MGASMQSPRHHWRHPLLSGMSSVALCNDFYLRRRSMGPVCRAIKSCKSHVLTNKCNLKLGHIVIWGLLNSSEVKIDLRGHLEAVWGPFNVSDKRRFREARNQPSVRARTRTHINNYRFKDQWQASNNTEWSLMKLPELKSEGIWRPLLQFSKYTQALVFPA